MRKSLSNATTSTVSILTLAANTEARGTREWIRRPRHLRRFHARSGLPWPLTPPWQQRCREGSSASHAPPVARQRDGTTLSPERVRGADDHIRDVTDSATNADPCTEVRETLTLTQTGVLHTTQHADGHHQTGGTVTATLRQPRSTTRPPTRALHRPVQPEGQRQLGHRSVQQHHPGGRLQRVDPKLPYGDPHHSSIDFSTREASPST